MEIKNELVYLNNGWTHLGQLERETGYEIKRNGTLN